MTLPVSTPARTSLDLGAALTDVRAPISNELSAVHVEKIKDHLIEIAAAINTDIAPNLVGATSWKDSVRVAATSNITLSGAQTIDGVSVVAGDDVLVLGQSTPSQNGIYTAASGAWSRRSDMVAPAVGDAVFVREGTASAARAFVSYDAVNFTDLVVYALSRHTGPIQIGVIGDATGELNVYAKSQIVLTSDYIAFSGAGPFLLGMAIDMNGNRVENLPVPTAGKDAATRDPGNSVVSGSHTFASADLGAVIHATGAGAQAFTLNTLASVLVSGRTQILTVQQEGAATQVTITCGSGVTINGSSSAYVATAGRTRISLISRDGLAWFTG